MKKKKKKILGTLAGINFVLSPEEYTKYKGTLQEQLEEKDKEIERLNNIIEKTQQDYTDEYNLRHKLSLELSQEKDKTFQLNNIINELEKWLEYQGDHTMQQHNYYSVLDKLKALKEGK